MRGKKFFLTQGLVFSGVRSLLYPDFACYGIVITARCDLAQGKVKQIHYVTAVPINLWFMRDCFIIISEEIIKSCQKKIKNWMTEKELNPTVIEEVGPVNCKTIIQTYEHNKTKRENILREIEKWGLAKSAKEGNLSDEQIVEALNGIFSNYKKDKANLVLKQQIHGFYFLPKLVESGDSSGYIVNLRDVHSTKTEYLEMLLAGEIDFLHPSIAKDDQLKKVFLLENEGDFAADIGIIQSPQIEHLMQHFSQLYSRIGIEELSDNYKEEIKNYKVCIN